MTAARCGASGRIEGFLTLLRTPAQLTKPMVALIVAVSLSSCAPGIPTTSTQVPTMQIPSATPSLSPSPSPSPVPTTTVRRQSKTWEGPDTYSYDTSGELPQGSEVAVEGRFGEFALVSSQGAGELDGYVPIGNLSALPPDVPVLDAWDVPPVNSIVLVSGDQTGAQPSDFGAEYSLEVPKDGFILIEARQDEAVSVPAFSFLTHSPLLSPFQWEQIRFEFLPNEAGALEIRISDGHLAERPGEEVVETIPLGNLEKPTALLLQLEFDQDRLKRLIAFDRTQDQRVVADVAWSQDNPLWPAGHVERLYFTAIGDPIGASGISDGQPTVRAWSVVSGKRTSDSWLAVSRGLVVPRPSTTVSAENVTALVKIGEWGEGEVATVAYSQDGSILAVGTLLGNVHLFDSESLREIAYVATSLKLTRPLDDYGMRDSRCYYCGDIAVSPDHRYLAAVGSDGTTGIWALQLNERLYVHESDLSTPATLSVHFIGDGGVFTVDQVDYMYGRERRTTTFFRTRDGEQLKVPADDPILSVAVGDPARQSLDQQIRFMESGSSVLTAYQIQRWDHKSYQVQQVIPVPSKLGQMYLMESRAALDVTGERFMSFNAYELGGFGYGSTPRRGVVEVWDLPARKRMVELDLSLPRNGLVAFDPRGRSMAVITDEAEVTVFSLPEGEQLGKLSLSPTCSGRFESSPDGTMFAAAYGDFIHVCSSVDGSLLRTFDVPTGEVVALSLSPDNLLLASAGYAAKAFDEAQAGYDPYVRIWSLEDGSLVHSFKAHHGDVTSLTFSPNGEILVTGAGTIGDNTCFDPAKDNAIRFWRVKDWKLLAEVRSIPNGVSDMAYLPGGDVLAVGGLPERYRMCGPFPEPSASLWLVRTGPPVFAVERKLEAFRYGPAQVEFWREANMIAAVGDWGPAFWSTQGTPGPSAGCGDVVCRGKVMALGAAGDLFALAMDEQNIGIWAARDSTLKGKLSVDTVYTWLAFSEDGTLLLGASKQSPGVITLWGIVPSR